MSTFDAASTGTPGSGATQNWNHTFSSSANRVGFASVALGAEGGPGTAGTVAVTAVKGGVDTAMIDLSGQIGSGVGGAGGYGYEQIFYIIDPDPGTTTIKVTRTGGTGTQMLRCGAISFTDAVTPVVLDTDQGNGNGTFGSTFTVAAGDIGVSFAICGNQITGGSDSQAWMFGSGNASGASYTACRYEAGSTGSITISHTMPVTDDYAIVGINVPQFVPSAVSAPVALESTGLLLLEQGGAMFTEGV